MNTLNRQALIAQLQTQILLLAAAGLKEYEADWLKDAKTVTRDGSGKFASKGSGDSQSDRGNSKDKEFADVSNNQKKSQQDLKSVSDKVDKIATAIDKLSAEQQDSLKDGINAPSMKKARRQLGDVFDKAYGEKIGEVYRDTSAKIEKEVDKQPGLAKAFNKAKEIVNNVVEGAKEDPSLVTYAAAGALVATVGVAGLLATVSVPNAIGIGGVYAGISAIATGETGAAIAGAFATGGLSQIGFGLSLAALSLGVTNFLTDVTALANKEFREQLKSFQAEAKKQQEEIQETLRDNSRAMVKEGYATKDGLATPKYIKYLKDNGFLNQNYPENKPYKIPYWTPL